MSSITPTELAFMIDHVVEGRSFALASFILFIWDYLITLDGEVQHFWSGHCSISRILFLCNRYFTLALLTCDVALRINFPLNLAALAIIQGILILRLWYLFQKHKVARYTLLAVFVLCTIGSAVTLAFHFYLLHSSLVDMPRRGLSYCADPPPSMFWMVFIPSFILHGVLSVFMIIRLVHNIRTARNIPLLKRCLRDGGFLYTVIFFSVSLSVSSAIVGVSPSVGVVAMFSNFMLALLSSCVSRVILNLSGLVQAYSVDPLSQAPALLELTAMVDRAAWEKKMGCLGFVPPYDDDVSVSIFEDDDQDDGFRLLKY
ncbi:hypothetical protein MSAN_01246400 [Mycena sanguinolenta]|uniref:DUF6533 domain-containing protein n=1 Tax=Mycena sanguinolenta TaxID=230812 RepID=A0A8H6YDF6_9AGAR|nr:hypothetical protein MSAN_01246400 [Mycena sanguinolenta]